MSAPLLRCAAVVTCRNEADLLQQHLPLQDRVEGEVEAAQHLPLAGFGVLEEGLSQAGAGALGYMEQHELQAMVNNHPVFSPRNSRISRSLRLWASPRQTSFN